MTLFWKIQTSKFTKVFLSFFVINVGSFLRVIERAEIYCGLIYSYRSIPFSFPLVPMYSPKTRFINYVLLRVSHVLSMTANTQIFPSVIKRISIHMIHVHAVLGLSYNAVHQYCNPFAKKSYRLISDRASLIGNIPFPLIQKLKHIIINQCKPALSKWNLFCHSILQTKYPPLRGSSTKQRAGNILARFHLLDPSEIYFSNYTTRGVYA